MRIFGFHASPSIHFLRAKSFGGTFETFGCVKVIFIILLEIYLVMAYLGAGSWLKPRVNYFFHKQKHKYG